jgi:2',3'-cyclic-nucleotide 2'-phosphodiesterase (5'-nucleotidase family)
VARRATVIDEARAAAEYSLLLDAGDSLLNDQDPAKSSLGATTVQAYNLMGYDAVTLGGLDIALLTVQDLQSRMSEAQFAMLSANATISATGELLAQPFMLRTVADHKVAILGISDPYPDDEILIKDPLATAIKWVPEMRKQADIVVLLSHAGTETDQKIAASVAGIDVIISGRNTGQIVDPLVVQSSGTVLFHADTAVSGSAGTHVGIAKLSFDASGKLTAQRWEDVPLISSIVGSTKMNDWLVTAK